MTEENIEQIAEAARQATAETGDYVEPDMIVELDNFRDYCE